MGRVGWLGMVFLCSAVAATARAQGMDAGVRTGLVALTPHDAFVALLNSLGMTNFAFGIICLGVAGVNRKEADEAFPKSWPRFGAFYVAILTVMVLLFLTPEWFALRSGRSWSWLGKAQDYLYLVIVAVPIFLEYRAPLRRWWAERRAAI